MNLEHKEKQEVFDEYARSQGYKNWMDLEYNFVAFPCAENDITKHIFNACDLVQQKALERASVNAKIKSFRRLNFMVLRRKFHDLSETRYTIDKESITNENNLIK